MTRFRDFLLDWRVYIPLLFWLGALPIADHLSQVGDVREVLNRTGNDILLVLKVMATTSLFIRVMDEVFLPDTDWCDSWKNGNELPVAIILGAIVIASTLVSGGFVSPF